MFREHQNPSDVVLSLKDVRFICLHRHPRSANLKRIERDFNLLIESVLDDPEILRDRLLFGSSHIGNSENRSSRNEGIDCKNEQLTVSDVCPNCAGERRECFMAAPVCAAKSCSCRFQYQTVWSFPLFGVGFQLQGRTTEPARFVVKTSQIKQNRGDLGSASISIFADQR